MCGIAMIAGTCDRESFESMMSAIAHRGDRDETYCDTGIMAGTRRLPIVDREHGAQPWPTHDGSGVLCYNGEIYNRAEMRSALASEDIVLHSNCDTEIVAAAFTVWGELAVPRLVGEFAFAAWRNGRVYVARDRIGVKPLYYTCGDGRVSIASEVKALIRDGQPIADLSPGSHGWLTPGEPPILRPYFDLAGAAKEAVDKQYSAESDAIKAVRDAVTTAIDSRLDTDLPVGVILSGGLDSSIVAARAAMSGCTCVAFTIGTADSPDLDYARRVASDFGIKHEVIELRRRDIGLSQVREAVEVSELTEYGDIINAAISIPLFRRIHESGIKIAIGGDGSDELFGGYRMYQDISAGQQSALFLRKLTNLGRTELQRVDRASMHSTVEMRVPFLDPAVVETAFRIPMDMKVRDGQEKWVVRRAFEDDLPEYVVNRPKHGLSYSSGLHDRVRLYKPLMPRMYREFGYDAQGPLRRDFDTALARVGNDLEKLHGENEFGDYVGSERLKDLLGAARWNIRGIQ